jgi:hypothetical protein
VRSVSKGRAKQNRDYSDQRKVFLKASPWCGVCWKESKRLHKADDIHHMKGRFKARLTDEQFWLPVCRFHHDKIHHEPAWAKANGWLLPL